MLVGDFTRSVYDKSELSTRLTPSLKMIYRVPVPTHTLCFWVSGLFAQPNSVQGWMKEGQEGRDFSRLKCKSGPETSRRVSPHNQFYY